LEVLVALSIVGIALLGFLRLHLISMATSDKVETLSRAMLLAQSKIAHIEATKQGHRNALSGTDDTHGTALHWQTEIQDKNICGSDKPLQEVVVRVWWDQGIGKRQIEMSTIIADRTP
jgi:type II secretory pathway pseudopilin PulG